MGRFEIEDLIDHLEAEAVASLTDAELDAEYEREQREAIAEQHERRPGKLLCLLFGLLFLCASAAHASTQIDASQCCSYLGFCGNGVLCPTGGTIYNSSTCINGTFGGRCVPNTPIPNWYNPDPTAHGVPIYTPTSYKTTTRTPTAARTPTPTFTPIR